MVARPGLHGEPRTARTRLGRVGDLERRVPGDARPVCSKAARTDAAALVADIPRRQHPRCRGTDRCLRTPTTVRGRHDEPVGVPRPCGRRLMAATRYVADRLPENSK